MAASAYHVMSKEKENRIFGQNFIFRHAYMYKQTILTKQWNYNIYAQILSQIYLRFFDVLFLLVVVILSEFHETPKRKD